MWKPCPEEKNIAITSKWVPVSAAWATSEAVLCALRSSPIEATVPVRSARATEVAMEPRIREGYLTIKSKWHGAFILL